MRPTGGGDNQLWCHRLSSQTTAKSQQYTNFQTSCYWTACENRAWEQLLWIFLFYHGTVCMFLPLSAVVEEVLSWARPEGKASTCRKLITGWTAMRAEVHHTPDLISDSFSFVLLKICTERTTFWELCQKDFKQIGQEMCHQFLIVFDYWLTSPVSQPQTRSVRLPF